MVAVRSVTLTGMPPSDVRGVGQAAARSTIVTVSLGEILVQLALTPVIAVLPSLATAIGVSAADGAWILTVFILALAGSLLVAGRLGDLLGHPRVFGLGALVYAGGGLGSGLAPTFEVLLAARAVQGLGAAMISGNNLAIVTHAVPASQRGRAIATVATASSAAAVFGSAAGTAVIAVGNWQLLFLLSAPLAVWAALRARRLPSQRTAAGRGTVDWAGAGLLVLTTTLLAIALNHPHTNVDEVVMPVFHTWLPALAVVSGGVFLAVERRVRVPLLDWGQLRNGPFAAAVGLNSILHLAMLAGMFLGPVLAVRGMGLDTTAGGMLMVVVQFSVVTTAYLGGWLYDRTRATWLRPAGAAVLALGTAVWAFAGLVGSYPGLVGSGLLAGLGCGLLLAVNNTVLMGILPAGSRGVASGLLETTRHFAHAFGVTIPTAILALTLSAAQADAEAQASALRWGFFLASMLMAAAAALGVGLAFIRPTPRVR